MLECKTKQPWNDFLTFMKEKSTPTEYNNWISPIVVVEQSEEKVILRNGGGNDLGVLTSLILPARAEKIRVEKSTHDHMSGKTSPPLDIGGQFTEMIFRIVFQVTSLTMRLHLNGRMDCGD